MSLQLFAGQFYGRTTVAHRVADLTLVDSHHAPQSMIPRHTHERAYFCINYGGTYEEWFGHRKRICTPGMLVFHPSGECHRQAHSSPIWSLNVEIGATLMTRVLDNVGPLDRPMEFQGNDVARAGLLLVRELRRLDTDSPLVIEALCWEILGAVARAGHGRTTAVAPRWMIGAHELLRDSYRQVPSLRDLAREAGVHPVHFAATFRRFYGCSVGEYVRHRRLEHVCALLQKRELSLSAIAAQTGFADQSHLTRTFKRVVGVTPSRYRTLLAFKTRVPAPRKVDAS